MVTITLIMSIIITINPWFDIPSSLFLNLDAIDLKWDWRWQSKFAMSCPSPASLRKLQDGLDWIVELSRQAIHNNVIVEFVAPTMCLAPTADDAKACS